MMKSNPKIAIDLKEAALKMAVLMDQGIDGFQASSILSALFNLDKEFTLNKILEARKIVLKVKTERGE